MDQLVAFYVTTFRTYERRFYHSFGEFLAHYLEFWQRANDHGVTHYEGIMRLLALMPIEWEGWAREQSLFYIFRDPTTTMLIGNFPNFIRVIHSRYIVFRHPPPGPYIHVPEYQMLHLPEVDEPAVDPAPAADPVQEPLIVDPVQEPIIDLEPEIPVDPVQEFLVDLEPEPSVGSAASVAQQIVLPPPQEPVPAVPPPPLEHEDAGLLPQIPAVDPVPLPEIEPVVDEPPPRRRRITASGSFIRVPVQIVDDTDSSASGSEGEGTETEPSEDKDESSVGPQAS